MTQPRLTRAKLRESVDILSDRDPDIRNIRDMISGHLLDSLAVRPFLHGARIIDIGTGAGFPGLPLAIAEPDRSFTKGGRTPGQTKSRSWSRHNDLGRYTEDTRGNRKESRLPLCSSRF